VSVYTAKDDGKDAKIDVDRVKARDWGLDELTDLLKEAGFTNITRTTSCFLIGLKSKYE
jgi:hypothetical protein